MNPQIPAEDPNSRLNALEELLGLRTTITKLHRELFQVTNELETSRTGNRKRQVALVGILVELIDNLQRTVAGLKSSQPNPPEAGGSKTWIGQWFTVIGAQGSLDPSWIE